MDRSLTLDHSSGDGASTSPVTPGQLVVVEVILAENVARGPVLPLFLERVPPGFPSPADEYGEARLDLHELTGATSPSCYFLRVAGESMVDAGLLDGDILVVDRAVKPTSGCVVVASVDGELTVKKYLVRGKGKNRQPVLLAANPDYAPIELSEGPEMIVWGVVTYSFHDHRVRRPRGEE